jgi:hypothetical protein
MRDRSEQILRLVCFALAALVVVQLVHAVFRGSSLAGVTIPPVPTLTTNSVSVSKTTTAKKPHHLLVKIQPTNSTTAATNEIKTTISSNAEMTAVGGTTSTGTNKMALQTTNGLAKAKTNSAMIAKASKKPDPRWRPSMMVAGGMHFGGFPMMPGMPGNAPKLSPEIQARVDEIVSSGILAPVVHPLPMGLLGIAGDTAFLRTASGQTGLVKVGDSLGDIKLLRIGINRVLIEQGGQKKELMIFDGYGGESLLSQTNEISK